MSIQNAHYPVIGYASGLGAGDAGCADGPSYLVEKGFVKDIELLFPDAAQPKNPENKYRLIAEHCLRLAKLTNRYAKQEKYFTVIGGDHTCAIGTWSGAAHALRKKGDLGLVWIDAHLDSNTPETTPSGNIHGMPVAALLGYGERSLTEVIDKSPKIKPQNFCFIGIRSYESGEYELIKKLNIRTFFMPEVEQLGFEQVFKMAAEHVCKHSVGYGISLDLDGIDPSDAPGVGSPEKDGLNQQEVCRVLCDHLNSNRENSQLCGFEVAEYNPHRDINNMTAKIILDLLK